MISVRDEDKSMKDTMIIKIIQIEFIKMTPELGF